MYVEERVYMFEAGTIAEYLKHYQNRLKKMLAASQ